MPEMKVSKSVYWTIKIVLGIFGIVAIYQIVPYLTNLLNLFVELYKISEMSPEFKLITVCIGIYLTVTITNMIANILFKIQSFIKETQ